MECVKNPSINVTCKECEKCLSLRLADPICFKRGFIWGVPDEAEPEWALSLEGGVLRQEDVSKYYDLSWVGNTHLLPIQYEATTKKKQYIPPDIRWQVWERDNFTCKHCGTRRHLSIDHIYPEFLGGHLELSNLQTLCRSCNSKKGISCKNKDAKSKG